MSRSGVVSLLAGVCVVSAEEPVLTVYCSADIEMHGRRWFVRVCLMLTPVTRCPKC
jgi:hypothetical protein